MTEETDSEGRQSSTVEGDAALPVDPFAAAKRFEADNRFDLAEQQYQKAIELQVGDLAAAYEGRGRALARLGRLEEAAYVGSRAGTVNGSASTDCMSRRSVE